MHCKAETRTKTISLSTLKRVIGFHTDVKAARESKPVNSVVISIDGAGISALPLFVIIVSQQTSAVKETRSPLVSAINRKSAVSVFGAHTNMS